LNVRESFRIAMQCLSVNGSAPLDDARHPHRRRSVHRRVAVRKRLLPRGATQIEGLGTNTLVVSLVAGGFRRRCGRGSGGGGRATNGTQITVSQLTTPDSPRSAQYSTPN